jgi:hypothetical protein
MNFFYFIKREEKVSFPCASRGITGYSPGLPGIYLYNPKVYTMLRDELNQPSLT